MKERTKNILGYGALLLGGAALLVAMLAGSSDRPDSNIESNSVSDVKHSVLTQQFAHQLAEKKDARSLFFASILIGSGSALMPVSQQKTNEALAEKWIQSAIETDPNDSLLAWHEASRCFGSKACTTNGALERLKKLEPDNAAVHLLMLNYAQHIDNQAGADAAFQRMLGSRYYNGFYHEYAKAAYLSMSDWKASKNKSEREHDAKNWGLEKPLSDEDYRKIQSLGIAIAFPLPGFQALFEYCGKAGKNVEKLEACVKLLEIVRSDQTVISKMMALSLLTKLTVNHPKGPQFREELRQYYWLRENQDKLNKIRPEYDSAYIQQWPNLTEWEALNIDMQKARIPTIAPKGWLPSDGDQRNRVLTGLDPKN